MDILIVSTAMIPVRLYGGIERVVWDLGKELVKAGHRVTYLVKQGSYCPFAPVIFIDESRPIVGQITADFDVVHFHQMPEAIAQLKLPYIITMHENISSQVQLDKNIVFLSKNHANRYSSRSFVYNGLDWDALTPFQQDATRRHFHFLGRAAWRVKNVRGAIDVIKMANSERLKVLGGIRFNINMGLRLTFSPMVSFAGMVGGQEKDALLNRSKGLIFPVRWHEPFGLAIIESLFYGCPVFATPYGSLPEIINNEVGFLSNKKTELVAAIKNSGAFSIKKCHDYAVEEFNSKKMALAYLAKYEKVILGGTLNDTIPKLAGIQKEKFLEWR